MRTPSVLLALALAAGLAGYTWKPIGSDTIPATFLVSQTLAPLNGNDFTAIAH